MPLRQPSRGSGDSRKKKNKPRFSLLRDIEPLEPRQLLTTLHGGDTFEYQDINSNIDRITLVGNITAEIIGASVDKNTNAVSLVDLPGNLYRNGTVTGLNGGLITPPGATPIGTITITDPFDVGGNGSGNIGALASDAAGNLYGINVVVPQNNNAGTGTQANLLQVVKIDSRTAAGVVIAEVHTQALALAANFSAFAGANPQITDSTAADFSPTNGLLYFVATGGANNTPVMYTINVNAADVAGSLAVIPGTFRSNGANATNVGDIVFDRLGPGVARLLAVLNIGGTSQIATINQFNTDTWTNQAFFNAGGVPVTGLAIRNDNPNAPDNIFYGVTGTPTGGGGGGGGGQANPITAGSEIQITVNGNNASVAVFGTLNTAATNPATGQTAGTTESNPGDLTFDPTFSDPFTGQTGALIGADLQTHDLFVMSPANRSPTTTLFNIYVSQSDATGGISIATTPKPPAPVRPMLPFSGSVGSIRYGNLQNEINAPDGTGSVLLGAKTNTLNGNQNSGDIPIINATLDAPHGVLPGGVGTQVEAGLVVAPGQDLGKFLFGGAVMGQVLIHGSIDQFYCGWLITGDASSGFLNNPNSVPPTPVPLNFLVDGDIRNLYVKGPIGTDPSYGTNQTISTTPAPRLDAPTYDTTFMMYVNGNIGQIRAGGAIVGQIEAGHATTAFALAGPQHEAEYKPIGSERSNTITGFPFVGYSAWDDVQMGGDPFFSNDTFQTPEILGSLPANGPGSANSFVSVEGTVQGAGQEADFVDFYGVALMAGQTVTVQLTNVNAVAGVTTGTQGLLNVGVFDPDQRLIATDYNDVNEFFTNNLPFRFTADRPGLYRFAVTQFSNPTFLANPPVKQGVDVPYTLNILNVGDVSFGGVLTQSSFLDRGIKVDHGDFGGVEAVAGTLLSSSFDSFDVLFGNLRSVEAGSIGVGLDSNPGLRGNTTGNNGSPSTGVAAPPPTTTTGGPTARSTAILAGTDIDLAVPNGSVGLLSALGNGAANVLLVNESFTPTPIGGDIQTVNAAGAFSGRLYANGGIGTIRAGDMNVLETSEFRVNMDGKGEDGTIDLIDVLGDFGTLGPGGPRISTGPGGNVRYIKVGGTVYTDLFFGGNGQPVNSVYNPGVSATIVDDSGSLIKVTPEGSVPNPNFVAGTLDPTSPAFNQFQLAQLNLTTYPIEGSGGSVLINATSTGSLTISSNGDVPGQTAEVSRIEVRGPGSGGVTNTTTITPQATGIGIGTFKRPRQQPTQPAAPVTATPPTTTTTSSGNTSTGGTTSGSGQGGSGSIFTTPPPSAAGPGGAPGLQQGTGSPLFVHITGPGTVDVLNIVVLATPGTTGPAEQAGNAAFGDASEITNTTGGELVSVVAQSIGRLFSTGSIGIAEHHTAAATNPMQVLTAANNLTNSSIELYPTDPDISAGHFIGNLFPFQQQRVGVVVENGNLLSVEAPVLGNIIVDGSIGQVIADGNTPGQGIVAPIVAYNFSLTPSRFGLNAPATPGNIGSVQIGGGIAPSGSGGISAAGIYADGRVGTVTGNSANIRGNIVTGLGVDSIRLQNGSLINADIGVSGAGQQGLFTENNGSRFVFSSPTPLDQPTLDIGNITINGNGGIIGTSIQGDHIGTIAVNGGFGIFTSLINLESNGTIDTIRADGYGIRDTQINAGLTIGSLIATQNGQQIPSSSFSPDVRVSETAQWDPYFGIQPSFLTDIDAYLGTNASTPINPATTDGGVIEDCVIAGSRDLRTARAFHFRDTTGGVVNTTTVLTGAPFNVTGTLYSMSLSFGNSIGTLQSVGSVNGLGVTTGKITNLQFGSDVNNLDLELSGRINKLNINGNLANGSIIYAKGNNGNIGTIRVRGNVDGTIKAQRKIGTIFIGGNLTGTVDAPNIQKVQAGSLNAGTFTIDGNLQSLISLGDLGTPGQSILVHGSVGAVKAGGNLNASMTVEGNMKLLKIGGSIISGVTVSVARTLTSLQVGGDIQANAIVEAHLIRHQTIKGQLLGKVLIV